MLEIWKDIEGYEGLYQVSNLGRVKSLNYRRSNKEKILQQRNNKVYKDVMLSKEGKHKRYLVHRLVALAFIPNDNLLFNEVNHKDENPSNNRVENLEWCDAKYNSNYGNRNKNIGNAQIGKTKEKLKKRVRCVETGEIFNSITEVSEHFRCSQSNISCCLLGKTKTACGYHWEYYFD